MIKIETWPCGHPRTAANTQNVGKAGVRCKECRQRITREHMRRKAEAAGRARPEWRTRP
jgi:hypothetical protein